MLLVMLMLAPGAALAQVCVSDMAGLIGALDGFNSGQSVVILLEQNTYVVDNSQPNGSAKLGAFGNEDYPASIVILGGYKNNCSARELDPSKTTIDGNHEPGSFLALHASGSIVIEAVTIQNMTGDPTNAAATVELSHNYKANASGESIKLERSRILYNAGGLPSYRCERKPGRHVGPGRNVKQSRCKQCRRDRVERW